MSRRHYIRFFISSTFADMEVERDLLIDIFKRISEEYQREKGWIVEYVDLRWGISENSSRDNRTMGICKAELKRCQELSPKPNFIVLVGERYGWIPLPEVVPNLLAQFINAHTDIFKQVYRQDFNNISFVHKNFDTKADNSLEWVTDEGPWILKPFDNSDVKKRKEKIEEPLQEIFEGVALGFELSGKSHIMQADYAHSATEQEIYAGAFQVEDANSHVVAYLRTLSSVPPTLKDIYQPEENSDRVALLREKLDDYLDKRNVIKQDVNFKNYGSAEYNNHFIAEMEMHIRRVIDAEIERTKQNEPTLQVVEKELQDNYIALKGRNFWGRDKEIDFLRSFIIDKQDVSQLWISGDRYTGKSALATKVFSICKSYNAYVESSRKIHIYYVNCGQTTLTSTAIGLLDYLHYFVCKDFCYLKSVHQPNDLVENRKEDFNGLFYSHDLHYTLNHIKRESNNKIVIVIDNLDKLSIEEIRKLRKQNWRGTFNDHLRIIYTCSGKHEEYFPLDKFKELNLGTFMQEESILIVNNLLKRRWRTITEEQNEIMKKTLLSINCNGAYLNSMAYYLGSFVNSWTPIEKIPDSNENIYEKIISCIVNEYHHDIYLVWLSLTLIALTDGINDQELTDILSNDIELRNRSVSTQFHKWKDNFRMPPIYWHRLAHDLKEFVSYEHSPYGEVNQIIIEDFREYVLRRSKSITLSGKSVFDISVQAQYNYYKDLWSTGNMRSLYDIDEMIYQYYSDNPALCIQELSNLTFNLQFTSRVVERFGNHISRLFDRLFFIAKQSGNSPLFEGKQLQRIQQLRNWLIANCHLDSHELMLKAHGENDSHPIQQCICDPNLSDIALDNALRNHIGLDCIIFQPSDIYQQTVGISQDSMHLISIDETKRIIYHFDRANWRSANKRFAQSINDIKISDNADRIAMTIGSSIQVYDTFEWKRLTSLDCHEEKICNFSLSHNGKLLAFTLEDYYLYIWDVDENEWLFNDSISNKIKSINFSISDRSLWLLGETGVCRFDYYDDVLNGWHIPFLDEKPELTELLASSDGGCLIKIPFQLLGFFVREGKAYCCSYAGLGNTLAGEGATCAIARPDNTFTVSLEGLMWDLTDGGQSNPRNVHSLHQMTNDGKYGVDDWCVIYDIDVSAQKAYQITTTDSFFEVGLNCVSSDVAGSWIVLSACKAPNREQEQHIASVTISNNDRVIPNITIPPFVDGYEERILTSASAVSPDGTLCAFTDLNSDEFRLLLTDRDINRVISKHIGKNTIGHETDSIRSLYWTQDSKYIIGAVWHHIANASPHIFLFNRDGDYLKMIPNDEPGPLGYDCFITANNEFVIQWFGDEFHVINLSKGVLSKIIGKDERPSGGVMHPSGKFLLYSSKESLLQNLIESYDVSGRIVSTGCGQILAISPSGRFVYMQKSEKSSAITCFDMSDNTKVDIEVDTMQVVPTYDDKYIYVRTCNDKILLINRATTKIVQEMYVKIAKKFIQGTCNGLVVATISGSPMLLQPHKNLHVNDVCYTTAIKRKNLEKGIFNDAYTAICPHCGHEIDVPKEVQTVLLEIDSCQYNIKAASNPILSGYLCSCCKGKIIFNYFKG